MQVVYGPGTFVNASAGEIQDQIQARMRRQGGRGRARRARRAAGWRSAQGKPPAEQRRLGRAARQLVYAEFVRDLLQIDLRTGSA